MRVSDRFQTNLESADNDSPTPNGAAVAIRAAVCAHGLTVRATVDLGVAPSLAQCSLSQLRQLASDTTPGALRVVSSNGQRECDRQHSPAFAVQIWLSDEY